MKRRFSLRGRMFVSLLTVFVLGALSAWAFYRWELAELQQEWWAFALPPAVAEAQLRHMMEEDVEFLLVLFLPFGILAIAVIAITTHLSLRGVVRIAEQARRIGGDSQDARLDTHHLPEEIRHLVEAVNGTLDRLATANALQRRFTDDAAHQLRTPLAVLQLRLQKARLEGATDWTAVEQDLAQLNRIVSQLLALARTDAGSEAPSRGDWRIVNLARVLRETAAQMLPLAESLQRPMTVTAPDSAPMRGHDADLRDMLRNLLENALHHGQGQVQGRLFEEQSAAGARVVLEVSDEGPGVPTHLQEAVFERFRKLSAHSPGPGLGLAIVRQIVGMHGGEIHFQPDAPCRVRVSFPLPPDARTAEH